MPSILQLDPEPGTFLLCIDQAGKTFEIVVFYEVSLEHANFYAKPILAFNEDIDRFTFNDFADDHSECGDYTLHYDKWYILEETDEELYKKTVKLYNEQVDTHKLWQFDITNRSFSYLDKYK